MRDIFVQMLLELHGKDIKTREIFVGGMLSGILIQRALLLIGSFRYDGAFVAAIKNLADKKLSVVIREQGIIREDLLYDGQFVEWNEKQGLESKYFNYFEQGMMWVCNLYEEFSTVHLRHPEIIALIYRVTDNRVAELKKMI